MRIKDKAYFVIGVIDLLGGIACLIACIYLHRGAKIALTFCKEIAGWRHEGEALKLIGEDENET